MRRQVIGGACADCGKSSPRGERWISRQRVLDLGTEEKARLFEVFDIEPRRCGSCETMARAEKGSR